MPRQTTTRRSLLRTASAVFAVAPLAGCVDGGDSSPQTIEMDEASFVPSSVSISPGTTVRWKNTSDVEQTVTAYEDKIPNEAAYFASGGFDSEQAARNNVTDGLVAPRETYEHTFDQAGTYEYFCIPHESSGMIGTVRVE
ncbi:MAG: plastocyanin/azurin family copper-binding protein [Halopenitus sp.]